MTSDGSDLQHADTAQSVIMTDDDAKDGVEAGSDAGLQHIHIPADTNRRIRRAV